MTKTSQNENDNLSRGGRIAVRPDWETGGNAQSAKDSFQAAAESTSVIVAQQ